MAARIAPEIFNGMTRGAKEILLKSKENKRRINK